MFCAYCNRMFESGDKVTVIIPDVEVTGRYSKNREGYRLKLSTDAIEIRASHVYCNDCLNVKGHCILDG